MFQKLKPFYQVWLLAGVMVGESQFNSFRYSSRIETKYNYYYLDDAVLGKTQPNTLLTAALVFDTELKGNGMLHFGLQYYWAFSPSAPVALIQDNQSQLFISGKLNSLQAFITFPLVTLIHQQGWKRVKNHAAFIH